MTSRADRFRESIGAVNEGASFLAFAQSLNPKVGTSMLDVPTMGLTEPSLIDRELRTKGVDLDVPGDFEYISRIFLEAVSYYNRVIAADPALRLHPISPELGLSFETPEEVYTIFKIASGQVAGRRNHKSQIMQACALLRIAYVIDFIERDPRLSLLPQVTKELQRILDRHITPPKNSGAYAYYHSRVPGDIPLPLVKFEIRLKDRDRIITKLLQKSENRTARVLDNIGFRITTDTELDTLRLMYAIFFDPVKKILPGMNIRPAESKMLLFGQDQLQALLTDAVAARRMVAQLSRETIDHVDLTSITVGANDNPHSSEKYRAIHAVFDLPLRTPLGQRTSFPVEGQFLDRTSAYKNDEAAPHDDYVTRQMTTVRSRLVGSDGNLLKYDKSVQE